ncbi:universal stress protein, partial [Halorubrum sp. SS7]|uniref:universal stress protein n=1 Tax=Halorubrum sp. SS7 TaxID=2518119 RepID=UPI00113B73D4
ILAVGGGEKPVGEDGDEPGKPFDHVVLASQGRTGISRVLLGSVAEGVVRRAEVPVTVVR